MNSKPRSISIIGCGWLGLPLAEHLQQQGYYVRGTSRNAQTLAQLTALGIDSHRLDLQATLDCDALERLFASEVLYINVPPGRQPQSLPYAERMKLLAQTAWQYGVRQAIFVSSTAVYAAGIDIDEQGTLATDQRGQNMLKAEQAVHAVFGEGLTILRLAGLVGGERHPGRFLAGKEDLSGKDHAVNLVHRDDVIAASALILEQAAFGECFNLVAANHPSRGEFYPWAARQLGLTEPTFCAQGRDETSKRISGQYIERRLGFCYEYSDPFAMPFGSSTN